MSEPRTIREDPLTGEHVVLTAVRSRHLPRATHGRPGARGIDHDHRAGESVATCPFCPGNESHTHPTIEAVTSPDGAWVARSFANRCPVLVLEEAPQPYHDGILGGIGGFGVHEVLVESPDHEALHDQPDHRTEAALELAVRRLRALEQDARLLTLTWFRNHGPASGGSQRHPHAQIVGMPIVPERWQRYAGRARHHLAETGERQLATLLASEHRDGRRILGTSGPITALCPFAPSHAFEVWLVPEHPGPRLSAATEAELAGIAALMPSVVRAIEAAVGGAISYTATVLGAARGVDATGVGWHVRILPRLARHGGLERGTHVAVHGVFPEDAAQAIRQAMAR